VLLWYGDIGLASSGDGGAVFFWSQIRQQYGLFARRFGGAGQVTGVDPAATTFGLRSVRFVPGVGVRVSVTSANPGATVLELFDVTGRRIAKDSFETGVGTIERSVPGTSALASGLYFARLSCRDAATTARVAVTR